MVNKMLTLIDRIIIWAIGINGLIMENATIDAKLVVCILLSGLMLCILYILDNSVYSKAQWIFSLDVCFIVVPCWNMQCFMGLVIYSSLFKAKKNKEQFISVITLIGILNVFLLKNKELFYIYYIILSYFISIIMAVKTRRLLDKSLELQTVRDDSAERNNSLSIRNKYLLENQENQIHIATLSERNRIAREIHDNVGHLLSRSILQVGACIAINKGTPVEKQLLPIKDTLDEAMNSIRESVHDLHKDSFDLKIATEAILEELKNFKIDFEYDISENADKNIKYVFITILKEAVTNIIKHSNGDSVVIIMRELERNYQLLIEDNGKVSPNSENYIKEINEGIGLTNMEERVKGLSGIINFSIENGFRIFISVPKEV